MTTSTAKSTSSDTPTTFKQTAVAMAVNGYAPVPIGPGTKWPPIGRWQHYQIAAGDAERYAGHGAGILCGEVLGVDSDLLIESARDAVLDAWIAECPEIARKLQTSPYRIGQAPKFLFMLRAAVPGMRKKSIKLTPPEGGDPQGIEVLATGQQFVGFAIHPDTGQPYQWNGSGSPLTVPLENLQTLDPFEVDRLLDVAEAALLCLGWTKPPAKKGSAKGAILRRDAPVTFDLVEGLPPTLRALLEWCDADDYDSWIAVGHALKMAVTKDGLDECVAEEAWIEWSQTSGGWREGDTDRWSGFRPVNSAGLHSICAALKVKPHIEAALRFEMNPAASPEAAGAPDDGGVADDMFEDEKAPPAAHTPAALAVLQAWRPRTPAEVKKIAPVEYGVTGLFPRGHVGLMPAKGNTGKTTLMLTLGVCHALEQPFFGHATVPGTFVLLSLDDPQEDLNGALARIIAEWPTPLTEQQIATIGEKVRVISLRGKDGGKLIAPDRDERTFSPSPLVPGLTEWLRGIPDLIGLGIDTVRQFTGVDSSNEPAGLTLMHVAAKFAEIERKPYVVLAHHLPKAAARSGIEDMHSSIGTTALPDNSRFVLLLTDLAPEEVTDAEVPFGADLIKLEPMRGSLLVKKAPAFIVARTGFRFELLEGARRKTREEKKVDATAETRAKHVAKLIEIFEAHGVIGRDRATKLGWGGRASDWNDQKVSAEAAMQAN